ncbi:TetR/AcrR family transcriptional regulator [Streptomyces capparidis]
MTASRPRPVRRTQQERSEATAGDLLRAARELFAREGYAGTSLEAVCERARVSKGALYHHFRNKEELFRVVCAREQERIAEAVSAAYRACGGDDSWEALFAGCRAFLEVSMDPAVQRITLLDAPSALGWEVLRQVREGCYGQLRGAVERAVERGRVPARPVDPLATMLYGAICESATAMARAGQGERDVMLRETLAELRTLFAAMAGDAVPAAG